MEQLPPECKIVLNSPGAKPDISDEVADHGCPQEVIALTAATPVGIGRATPVPPRPRPPGFDGDWS